MQPLANEYEEIKTLKAGYWLPEEIAELMRLDAEGCGEAFIAAQLGRTVPAIRYKRNYLGMRHAAYRVTYAEITPIARVASDHFQISVHAMRGLYRGRAEVHARHVAMWLALRMGRGYAHVGRFFRRDHTSVIHAEHKIERLRASDDKLRSVTDALLATVRENAPAPPPAAVSSPKPPTTPEPKTATSDPPGPRGEGFYLSPEILEAQEDRFRAAMVASGEWPV